MKVLVRATSEHRNTNRVDFASKHAGVDFCGKRHLWASDTCDLWIASDKAERY